MDQQNTSIWNVLPDGTVIHEGKFVFHRPYNYRINPKDVCKTIRPETVSFIIAVESEVKNFERRELIRNTWGLSIIQGLANYRVVFLVGLTRDSEVQASYRCGEPRETNFLLKSKVDYESMIYGDMIQIEIDESFLNLTHKSLHMLNWFTVHCGQAQYLFKTDDDIYLHVPNIIKVLTNSTSSGRNILCHKNKSRRIIRNIGSHLHQFDGVHKKVNISDIRKKFVKYIVKQDQIPGSLYPQYCSGFNYIMNHEVAFKLFQSSHTIPYLGIEDVFVTGFCRQKVNIGILDSPMLTLSPRIFPLESKCVFSETGRINSNEMDVADIKSVWYHLNTNGYYCKQQEQQNKNTTQK